MCRASSRTRCTPCTMTRLSTLAARGTFQTFSICSCSMGLLGSTSALCHSATALRSAVAVLSPSMLRRNSTALSSCKAGSAAVAACVVCAFAHNEMHAPSAVLETLLRSASGCAAGGKRCSFLASGMSRASMMGCKRYNAAATSRGAPSRAAWASAMMPAGSLASVAAAQKRLAKTSRRAPRY
jgi:hypothetical protein